ncbi:hypothetical protein NP233_g1585 [Leucocoprinus birnbaumii]|uniref:Uncharacterized protein n=1 Tax=Leucocoprinus birnbaumii TaxID=56174 RepID=A0AAD5W2B6_9AGAR|nr:hypothetical protein NP233_g1585 [Leucocoprinus birnbaumii]
MANGPLSPLSSLRQSFTLRLSDNHVQATSAYQTSLWTAHTSTSAARDFGAVAAPLERTESFPTELSLREAIDFASQYDSLPRECYEEDPIPVASYQCFRLADSNDTYFYYDMWEDWEEKKLGRPERFPSKPQPQASESLPSEWNVWSEIDQRLLTKMLDVGIRASSPYEKDDVYSKKEYRAFWGKYTTWLCNSRRQSILLFVDCSLYQRVDRDAIRICTAANRLGARIQYPWFDSKRDQLRPQFITVYLALQLAARCPPYRELAAHVLADNHANIFTQDIEQQFSELIVRPWETLAISHPQYLRFPIVIVLNLMLQSSHTSRFLNILSRYAQKKQSGPLLFLVICSHNTLNSPLGLEFPVAWEATYLLSLKPIPLAEAGGGALEHTFQVIRVVNSEWFMEDEIWPSERDLSELGNILNVTYEGKGYLANAVLSFIMHHGQDSPQRRLRQILDWLGTPSASIPTDIRDPVDRLFFSVLAFNTA